MAKGITKSGFEFEVDAESLNDMEFVDAIVDAINSDNDIEGLKAYTLMANKLLGKEQKKKLYDHVRDERGRVPMEAVQAEIEEIMLSLNEAKN